MANFSDFNVDFDEQDDTRCNSVSELNHKIRMCLEGKFPPLWVQGEISNFVNHSSGHWYFTLKDSESQIKMVMFRGSNQKLNWVPVSGLEIKVFGRISVYKPRGEYQLICEKMEQCGKGALQEKFEKLKNQLKTEGLFERKTPLPFLPKHIAIISSPTGAAIRDILNILRRRYKALRITLVPAIVQGEKAPASLIKALSLAKQLTDVDVLIITRGGGSLEDLWAFNDEELARALFCFPKPVISAVGHEIDFSICDFVADLRAPTPSAAAELVVKNQVELLERVKALSSSLYQSIYREFQVLKNRLRSIHQLLIGPERKIQELQQSVDDLNSRLIQYVRQQNKMYKQNLMGLSGMLDSLSPLKVLNRGYALVSRKDELVRQAKDLKSGDEVALRFSKDTALARIMQISDLKQRR